jgi:hypothetical protein
MPDIKDLSDQYNTPLSDAEERTFQAWAQKIGRQNDTYDYDLRGAWKAGASQDPNGHMTDAFKKPNHPTFSDQSIYNGRDGFIGGHWTEQPGTPAAFQPGQANLHWRSADELKRYFNEVEGDRATLILPQTRGK